MIKPKQIFLRALGRVGCKTKTRVKSRNKPDRTGPYQCTMFYTISCHLGEFCLCQTFEDLIVRIQSLVVVLTTCSFGLSPASNLAASSICSVAASSPSEIQLVLISAGFSLTLKVLIFAGNFFSNVAFFGHFREIQYPRNTS